MFSKNLKSSSAYTEQQFAKSIITVFLRIRKTITIFSIAQNISSCFKTLVAILTDVGALLGAALVSLSNVRPSSSHTANILIQRSATSGELCSNFMLVCGSMNAITAATAGRKALSKECSRACLKQIILANKSQMYARTTTKNEYQIHKIMKAMKNMCQKRTACCSVTSAQFGNTFLNVANIHMSNNCSSVITV